MKPDTAVVIGGGLAGCEAAWQMAQAGIPVTLYEMRPKTTSPAHHTSHLAELVCSNSLRSDRLENASGLLKAEMRHLGSLILEAADACPVPAGGALAVDREAFSRFIEGRLEAHPRITLFREEVTEIPQDLPVVVAAGPLASPALTAAIGAKTGTESLYFFDAVAPIVTETSIDSAKVFRASRYGRGEDDYINCPMNKEQYEAFYEALIHAETADLKAFETDKVFDGCMPIEVMAKRGPDTMRYGPLKPVGLVDPATGREPYAAVQLRQDDATGRLYNLVGFQTHLKFGAQKRVFSRIPGLEQAEFVRFGVMHRNTFLHSPRLLQSDYSMRAHPFLYFAGQITGVEGNVESASSGLSAGLHLARRLLGLPQVDFTAMTAIGALAHYVSSGSIRDFQPMNINFGIMAPLKQRIKNKPDRCRAYAERSLALLYEICAGL